jgi:hypothetical protein
MGCRSAASGVVRAVRWGHMTRNPGKLVMLPAARATYGASSTPAEVDALVELRPMYRSTRASVRRLRRPPQAGTRRARRLLDAIPASSRGSIEREAEHEVLRRTRNLRFQESAGARNLRFPGRRVPWLRRRQVGFPLSDPTRARRGRRLRLEGVKNVLVVDGRVTRWGWGRVRGSGGMVTSRA